MRVLETSAIKAERLDSLAEVKSHLPFKDPKTPTRDFIEIDDEDSELFTTILDIEPDISIDSFFEELYTAEMIYGHTLCAKTDGSGRFYYQVLLSAKQLKAFASKVDFNNVPVFREEYPDWALRDGEPAHVFAGIKVNSTEKEI